MNKISKKYKAFIIAAGALLLFAPGLAWAVAPSFSFNVDFEQDPLFYEANFLPGDTVSRYVKVSNYTGTAVDVGVQSRDISDPGFLGDLIDLEIKENGTTLYSGTLTDFFVDSEDPNVLPLGSLPDGGNTQYDFLATFNPTAGNDTQGKSLNFDLTIGILGENENNGGEDGDGNQTFTVFGSTGGGGGGPSYSARLSVDYPEEKTVGELVTETVIVKNTKNISIPSAKLVITVPDSLEIVLPEGGTTNQYEINIGTLPALGEYETNFTVMPLSEDTHAITTVSLYSNNTLIASATAVENITLPKEGEVAGEQTQGSPPPPGKTAPTITTGTSTPGGTNGGGAEEEGEGEISGVVTEVSECQNWPLLIWILLGITSLVLLDLILYLSDRKSPPGFKPKHAFVALLVIALLDFLLWWYYTCHWYIVWWPIVTILLLVILVIWRSKKSSFKDQNPSP